MDDLSEIRKQLSKLQLDFVQHRVESLTIREVLTDVAECAGMDPGAVATKLFALENQKWDEYLRHIEDKDPAAAAWADRRKIKDIPTDGDSTK